MSEQAAQGLNPREYWTLSGVSVACVMLVVINISLTQGNREMGAKVAKRQIFIAQTAKFNKINKQLIKAIAQFAERDSDSALRRVLSDQGITFNRHSGNADSQAGE